jgi:hypothetical protein
MKNFKRLIDNYNSSFMDLMRVGSKGDGLASFSFPEHPFVSLSTGPAMSLKQELQRLPKEPT